jgi:hypothetical protein
MKTALYFSDYLLHFLGFASFTNFKPERWVNIPIFGKVYSPPEVSFLPKK